MRGALLAWLGLLALSACDRNLVVVATVHGLSSDVRALAATVALDGQPVPRVAEFTGTLSPLGFAVPPGTAKNLRLDLDGFTDNGPRVVGGSAADDVWAVGRGGVIVHWDGHVWLKVESGTQADLLGVWGTRRSEAWAVGRNGTVLRWDGSAWRAAMSGTMSHLYAVSGSGSEDVWVVGSDETILYWDGQRWKPRGPQAVIDCHQPNCDLFAVWAVGASAAWAGGKGGMLLRWDGVQWAAMDSGTKQDIYGLWGTGAADVWAVGKGGTVLHEGGGSSWSIMASGGQRGLYSVWGSQDVPGIWTAGEEGEVRRYRAR